MIQGNFIGTDVTGAVGLANFYDGIQIESGASNTTIGGTAVGVGNVVSANGSLHFTDYDQGIKIATLGGFGPVTGTLVQGNFIGTNAKGTAVLGNYVDGVQLESGPSGSVSNNTIGGSAARCGQCDLRQSPEWCGDQGIGCFK